MRGQLTAVSGAELAARRASAAGAWQARLEDLLQEQPGLAADLRVLVAQIRVPVPAVGVAASGHALAAGGNVSITASGGGTAAGVIHGSVTPGPTGPGRAS